MFLFISFIHEMFHLLAEIEACFSHPGSYLFLRKLELLSFGVKFKKKIWIGKNLSLYKYGGLFLGKRCALGDNTQLINHAPIKIGDDFLSSNNLIINSGTHDTMTLIPGGQSIQIGDRVWCGTRVTILAGVTIGSDVVLGAGSVVTQNIPSNCVAVGIPARPIKSLKRQKYKKLWSWTSEV